MPAGFCILFHLAAFTTLKGKKKKKSKRETIAVLCRRGRTHTHVFSHILGLLRHDVLCRPASPLEGEAFSLVPLSHSVRLPSFF